MNQELKISAIKVEPQAKSLSILADVDFDRFHPFAEALVKALD